MKFAISEFFLLSPRLSSCYQLKLRSIGIILLLGSFLSACIPVGHEKPPNVSNIDVDLEVIRFEQELFNIDTNEFSTGLDALIEKYPEFSTIYFGQLLGAPASKDQFIPYVKGFVSHPAVRQLYDTCTVMYQDLSKIESDLTQALKYYKYYFPNGAIPKVTTYISEYSLGNFIFGDNELAVGIDFFLGSSYPYWKYNPGNSNFSSYLIRTFNQDHLVMKTLRPLVQDICGTPKGERMLDHMINQGKQLYLMDKLLPETADSVILEMTAEQTSWLTENELEMWAFFLQQDLLYSSEWRKIRKYVEYSPNSPKMPTEAPGRTANWLGWQIVKAYMKRFPETSLAELVAIKDGQLIMDQSRYRPPSR